MQSVKASIVAALSSLATPKWYRYVQAPVDSRYGSTMNYTKIGAAFAGHLAGVHDTEVERDNVSVVSAIRKFRFVYAGSVTLKVNDNIGNADGSIMLTVTGLATPPGQGNATGVAIVQRWKE